MLEAIDLSANYGAVQAVRSVSFTVGPGEVLAVLGPNGAGKSTLANAVSGLHRPSGGRLLLGPADLAAAKPTHIARKGVALVPQGRRVFASCTVSEHAALAVRNARPGALTVDEVLEFFPRLRERWGVRARRLSGGEQQMLAITRAVLPGPAVLVLDEPTEGLAPSIVSAVGRLVRRLRDRGTAVLLMERPGEFARGLADRVAAMDRGLLSCAPPAGRRGGAGAPGGATR
ncbi:ABC transporter-like protein [Mycobacterium tuberculosis]|nr:ABC transporter-like protein [Mycobacterium tuberculosis]